MRAKLFLITLILTVIALYLPTLGQQASEKKLAILPFSAVGVDESTVQSAEAILRLEINAALHWNLVPENEVQQAVGNQLCDEVGCAADIGKKLNASRVLICNLTGLGEKILVYYTLVDVASGTAKLKDNATALYVEDLDAVLKRVAASVSGSKPIQRTAEVDNITAKESVEPLRRTTNTLSGFTFGYLFPQDGYDNDDRSFTLDFRVAQELDRYEIGLLLAARKGFAINIFGNYLFTKKDVCPFLGGAFGFHWIAHEQNVTYDPQTGLSQEDNRRGDGFELTLNGGLKLFRTYNFQILINFAYLATFNDYDDRATVFTIGLVK
jgi:hypothetical protein